MPERDVVRELARVQGLLLTEEEVAAVEGAVRELVREAERLTRAEGYAGDDSNGAGAHAPADGND